LDDLRATLTGRRALCARVSMPYGPGSGTIRMAAYNAETALACALDGHCARASDEAYALIREALTASGDICPGHGELLIQLDPLTAPRRIQALAALCHQLTGVGACYPGTDLVLRYEVKSRPSPA
jgi:hypothetical protein